MTQWAEGSHFEPKDLEQAISSYLHFIETGQGNNTEELYVSEEEE